MTTLKNARNYENIPNPVFENIREEEETRHAIIRHRIKATLRISVFVLIQLMLGAQLLIDEKLQEGAEHVEAKLVKLFLKISNLLLDARANGSTDEENILQSEFLRDEIEMMRTALEARMVHCEKERDAGLSKFNPNTYIAMKILLLDIRDWLSGSIVSVGDVADVDGSQHSRFSMAEQLSSEEKSQIVSEAVKDEDI